MHAKDFYLALILGLVIAQSTYDCLGALGRRFGLGGAVEEAGVAAENVLAPHASPPHVRHSPPHDSPRR